MWLNTVQNGGGSSTKISEAVSLYSGSAPQNQSRQVTLTESYQAILIACSDSRNGNLRLEYDGGNITAFYCQLSSSNQSGTVVAFGNFVSGKTLTMTPLGGGTTYLNVVGLK